METPGLFWGIVLKPEKRYETEVEEDFRVTKACVDTSTLEKGMVASVVLEKGSEEFILCNLNGPSNYDSSIDLSFAEGERICFRTEGGATVHLTGHLVPDDTPDESMMMGNSMFDSDGEEEEEAEGEEEEDSDDDEEEEEGEEVPKLVDASANGKRKLQEVQNGDSPKQSAKKAKKAEVKQAEAMKKILSKDKKKQEEDDSSDDMDADMDDLEDDSDDDSGEEEEEEAPTPKKKKEETPKKDKKKNKENGAAQTPKNGKQEAAPLTPKSDGKAEETPKSKKKDKKKKDKEGAPATPAAGDGKPAAASPTKTPKPQKKTLKGGIVAEDLRVGNGPEAKAGKHVGMYYKGTLTKSGKQFDACLQGKPFKFKLGKGEVIKGWDVGVEGMKVGGKRKLTIPAQMGYGSQGAMPDIPPNASLTFEVECKMVN